MSDKKEREEAERHHTSADGRNISHADVEEQKASISDRLSAWADETEGEITNMVRWFQRQVKDQEIADAMEERIQGLAREAAGVRVVANVLKDQEQVAEDATA